MSEKTATDYATNFFEFQLWAAFRLTGIGCKLCPAKIATSPSAVEHEHTCPAKVYLDFKKAP